MSTLKAVQVCRSRDGWRPVEIKSSAFEQTHMKYLVLVNPWGNWRENVCECPGYTYRGECKHQLMAVESLCLWSEVESREEQTVDLRKRKTCPRCGGPTKWEVEVEEAE